MSMPLPEDPLELSSFLPYRINVLSHRLSRSLARRYERRFGITIPDWRCLAVLARESGLTARELGKRTSLDKVQVSRTTARLDGRGLIVRTADPADRRAVRLEITDDGRRLFEEIADLARAWEQDLTHALGLAERRTLERVLGKLDDALDRLAAEDDLNSDPAHRP